LSSRIPVSLSVLLAACGQNDPVDDYLTDLPSWERFSPPEQSPPEPIGEPESFTVNEPLTDIGEDDEGNVVTTTYDDVAYDCTRTEYAMTETPEKFVTYSPDAELLYPGALVQGRSHRDGVAIGSLLPLPIDDRAPIRVSIPSIPSGTNFRELPSPNQAVVAGAIGEMVGEATLADLSTPSTIDFKRADYHDESEFALSIGVSGRYFGFSGSADGSVEGQTASTTVTAHFFQKMYEVVVEPPSTPGAFFADTFTEDKLQEQRSLGRIGPDNLPIYVSNVVYGRMLTYSVTSTAKRSQVVAALEATFRSLGSSASVEVSAENRQVLETSEIEVQSLGGDARNVLDLIRSGDLRAYFDEDAPLSSAAPLSYTFRNLGDGSIAAVAETTRYTVTECEGEAPVVSDVPIEPNERVAWLERIELLSDDCDTPPPAEIAFYFSAEQDGGVTEIVDRRDRPVTMGTRAVHELDRMLFEFSWADGTSEPITFVGDAWEHSNMSIRHFEGAAPDASTWEITYGSPSTMVGERCFTRHLGDCALRLFVCVVNGRADHYYDDHCVPIDPTACH